MKIGTKNELIELGIEVKEDLTVWRNGNLLKPYLVSCKHKYGKTTSYYVYVFYVNKVKYQIMRSNIMYCWFIGDRDITKDVDHIDNNSLNDNPDNLQLLTRQENLLKRGKGRNQWNYIRSNKDDKQEHV